MGRFAKIVMPLWVMSFCLVAIQLAGAQVPYAELHNDVGWSPANFTTVADIAAAFGSARTSENLQLGTAITTTLIMPSQAVWDAWSASQKALYLINAERIARGLKPFQGINNKVVAIAKAYADSLLANNAFTHTLHETTPTSRLNADSAINGCSEQGFVFGPECLSGFVASNPPIPMPVERSIHSWIYEDSLSSWGHRNTMFALLNDDFGLAGSEGFIGLGVAVGGPYSGFGGGPWPAAALVVFEFVDPCPTSTLTADQNPLALFTPDSLKFGSVPLGQSKRDSIRVSNTGNVLLTLIRKPLADTTFAAVPDTLNIGPGDSSRIFVTFKPARAESSKTSLIYVANGTANDTIALSGLGVNPPGATVTPRAIAFDSVLVLASRRDSIKVKNTGIGAFMFKAKTGGDSAFSVSPDSAFVAGGDSVKFFVTFRPRAAATDTGMILVTGPARTDTVSLSGRGRLLSLSAVRKATVGTLVSFQGSVSRAKGSFVYLQDSLAGIVLFQLSGMVRDSVASGFIKPGDRLIVNGKTSMFNNLLEVASADISGFLRLARGDSVKPVKLTLGQIAAQGAAYEGRLVTVDSLRLVGTSDTLFKAATSYNVVDKDTSLAVVLRIPNAGDSDVDSTTIQKQTMLRFTGPLGHFSPTDSTKGYQLMAVNATDVAWVITINSVGEDPSAPGSLPTVYALAQNYPNPFNPSTRIQFSLPRASAVQLKVYTVMGQEVATLVSGPLPAGRHTVTFNAGNLASGVYFYRLQAGGFVETRRLMLIK